MNQLLSIVDDKLVVEKLRLKYLDGDVTHVGSFDVKGKFSTAFDATFENNLVVRGKIEADSIHVKQIITDDAQQLDAFTFQGTDDRQLDAKGLTWHLEDKTYQFVFKAEPKRIYSSETIDLHRSAKYQIDGADVVLADRLGNSIKYSKLTRVGILESLDVDGDANLANTVIVKGNLQRVGINTETPNSALSVLDNGVELAVGSDGNGRGKIGTWTPHGLDIITDNTTRISIQGNNITFGSEKSKNAVVKINGSLVVDSIQTDIRVQRTAPIEFLEDNDLGLYFKGLNWKPNKGTPKQFFLLGSPDRFYSTESIDLSDHKGFFIGGNLVLDSLTLGNSIKNSSLESVGVLQGLTVGGQVNLNDVLSVDERQVSVRNELTVTTVDLALSLTGSGITTSDSFKLTVKDSSELVVSDQNLTLGNKNNTARTVNVYGKMSVNITHPDPDAALSVDGPVVFGGKKFANLPAAPESGNWNIGDVVWNTTPQDGGYVGWICILAGNPGVWRPFGLIGGR